MSLVKKSLQKDFFISKYFQKNNFLLALKQKIWFLKKKGVSNEK